MSSNIADKKRALELLNWLNDDNDKVYKSNTPPSYKDITKLKFKRGIIILTNEDIRHNYKIYKPELVVSIGKYEPLTECPNLILDIEDRSYIHIAKQYKAAILENLEKVHDIMKVNGTVIIHCQAGMSRAATFVLFYLITYCKMDAMHAIKFLKSRRGCIYPNLGFLAILAEYERELDRRNPGMSTALHLSLVNKNKKKR